MRSHQNRVIYPAIIFLIILASICTGCGDKETDTPHDVLVVQTDAGYLAEDYDVYLVLAFPKEADNPKKQRYITRDMVDDVLDYYHLMYKGNKKVKVFLYHNQTAAKLIQDKELYGEMVLINGEPEVKINHLR